MISGSIRRVRVALPGACGELVQGMYQERPCLVSCPIDRMVEIEVTVSPGSGRVAVPVSMPKTQQAVRRALKCFNRQDMDVEIRRNQALPEAKGYASSTADILAALFGTAKALKEAISAEKAIKLAISVEPTDSLAWEGLALLAYRDGNFMMPLNDPPPLNVLVLDWGGTVDTLAFNRAKSNNVQPKLSPVHKEAFALLLEGMAERDPDLIGQAASLSAEAHQRILSKPQLDGVMKLAKDAAAPGVCVAHSGSLIGVLLRTGEAEETKKIIDYIVSRLPGKPEYNLYAVVGGGPRYIQEEIKCPLP